MRSNSEAVSGTWELKQSLLVRPAVLKQRTAWTAPVLSYTRSSGAYAGANLAGSKLSADEDKIHDQYGEGTTFSAVLDGKVKPEASAQPFMSALDQVAQK